MNYTKILKKVTEDVANSKPVKNAKKTMEDAIKNKDKESADFMKKTLKDMADEEAAFRKKMGLPPRKK